MSTSRSRLDANTERGDHANDADGDRDDRRPHGNRATPTAAQREPDTDRDRRRDARVAHRPRHPRRARGARTRRRVTTRRGRRPDDHHRTDDDDHSQEQRSGVEVQAGRRFGVTSDADREQRRCEPGDDQREERAADRDRHRLEGAGRPALPLCEPDRSQRLVILDLVGHAAREGERDRHQPRGGGDAGEDPQRCARDVDGTLRTFSFDADAQDAEVRDVVAVLGPHARRRIGQRRVVVGFAAEHALRGPRDALHVGVTVLGAKTYDRPHEGADVRPVLVHERPSHDHDTAGVTPSAEIERAPHDTGDAEVRRRAVRLEPVGTELLFDVLGRERLERQRVTDAEVKSPCESLTDVDLVGTVRDPTANHARAIDAAPPHLVDRAAGREEAHLDVEHRQLAKEPDIGDAGHATERRRAARGVTPFFTLNSSVAASVSDSNRASADDVRRAPAALARNAPPTIPTNTTSTNAPSHRCRISMRARNQTAFTSLAPQHDGRLHAAPRSARARTRPRCTAAARPGSRSGSRGSAPAAPTACRGRRRAGPTPTARR